MHHGSGTTASVSSSKIQSFHPNFQINCLAKVPDGGEKLKKASKRPWALEDATLEEKVKIKRR